MPDKNRIQNELNRFSAFQMSSNQNQIVAGLSSFLGEGEELSLMQEGFYNGINIRDNSTGVFGFLFLTSHRLFFMSNDKSNAPRFEVLDTGKVKGVSIQKNFSSVTLTLQTPAREMQFRCVIPYADAVGLLGRIQQLCGLKTETPPEPQQKSDYEVFDKPVNNEMLNDFIRKISSVSKEIISSISTPQGLKTEDKDFLFQEAKKIYSQLEIFLSTPTLKDMIEKDLVVLSSMCTMADPALHKNESFFLGLVFLIFAQQFQAGEVFSGDSLADQYLERVSQSQQAISSRIKTISHQADKYPLETLAYLKRYDAREGTLHADHLSALYYTFAQCIIKADGTVTPAEEEILRQINTIIHEPIPDEPGRQEAVQDKKVDETIKKAGEPEKVETLDDVLKELNALVGMENIKKEISTFINLIKVQKARKEKGLPVSPTSLHAVFYGPPGTGKTTIARLLGRIYKCLELLSKGHIVETDRAGLVAGYVGQTAIKTDELIQKSLDGILFIDEAYALAPSDGGKDFGQEAIDTMLKRMEDYRERLVIIVAGYPDEMKDFINTNPGLKSRFSRYFYFDHYKPEELIKIFTIFSNKSKFLLTKKAREKLLALLTAYYEKRDKSFGNGRLARNLFEKTIERQANRIAPVTPLTDKILCTIKEDDIPEMDEVVL